MVEILLVLTQLFPAKRQRLCQKPYKTSVGFAALFGTPHKTLHCLRLLETPAGDFRGRILS